MYPFLTKQRSFRRSMNLYPKLAFLILLIVSIHQTGCKDPARDYFECEEIATPPNTFLDLWLFPEGSWWVYQNVADPTLLDTITITRIDTTVYPADDQSELCETSYMANFAHSYDGWPEVGSQNSFFTLRSEKGSDATTWVLIVGNQSGMWLPGIWFIIYTQTANIFSQTTAAPRQDYSTPASDFTQVYDIESNYDDEELAQLPNVPEYVERTYLSTNHGIVGFVLHHSGEWKLLASSTL